MWKRRRLLSSSPHNYSSHPLLFPFLFWSIYRSMIMKKRSTFSLSTCVYAFRIPSSFVLLRVYNWQWIFHDRTHRNVSCVALFCFVLSSFCCWPFCLIIFLSISFFLSFFIWSSASSAYCYLLCLVCLLPTQLFGDKRDVSVPYISQQCIRINDEKWQRLACGSSSTVHTVKQREMELSNRLASATASLVFYELVLASSTFLSLPLSLPLSEMRNCRSRTPLV